MRLPEGELAVVVLVVRRGVQEPWAAAGAGTLGAGGVPVWAHEQRVIMHRSPMCFVLIPLCVQR